MRKKRIEALKICLCFGCSRELISRDAFLMHDSFLLLSHPNIFLKWCERWKANFISIHTLFGCLTLAALAIKIGSIDANGWIYDDIGHFINFRTSNNTFAFIKSNLYERRQREKRNAKWTKWFFAACQFIINILKIIHAFYQQIMLEMPNPFTIIRRSMPTKCFRQCNEMKCFWFH